jgi:dTMP kinase
MAKSIFISFEGGEGSGKTTQVAILHGRMVEAGYPTVLVHEPGTTALGSYLREYLKGKHNLSREAELLLFVAARVELVNTVIRPNLKRGTSVVADRFADSTIAYQGYGRKISLEVAHFLNSFATCNLTPDITFLLDIQPEEGLRRVGQPQLRLGLEPDVETLQGRQDVEGARQFEDQPIDFHRRVRKGYLELVEQDPGRWVVIDAALPQEEVAAQVWKAVVSRISDT